MFRLVGLCLLFTSVCWAWSEPSYVLSTRDLLQAPYLEPGAEFENWWFGEGRVILNTVNFGQAPEAELSHELSVSGPVSPMAPADNDYDWRGSFRSIIYMHTDSRRALSWSVRHGVWFHFYRNPGYFSDYGPRSYRELKHQVRLAAQARLAGDKLIFYFPIYLQQSRYTNFRSDSRWDGDWRYGAWAAPELYYQLSDRWAVSAYYETESFVGSDLKRFYFWDSIAEGEVGVKFSATF